MSLGLCIAATLAYWWIDGVRSLDRELRALRDSGAPEFPAQIERAPRIAGEDPRAWSKSMDDAWVEWSVADLQACRDRLANGETESDVEASAFAALRDPRRIMNLSDCELAVLRRQREAGHAQLEIALRVEQLGSFDWAAAWSEAATQSKMLVAPPQFSGHFDAIWLLCQDAVRCAMEADEAAAMARLLLAQRAVALLDGAEIHAAVLAWQHAMTAWLEMGVLPVLHLLPADSDWSEVAELLASLDLSSQLRRGLLGERAMINACYAGLRNSGGLDARDLPLSWIRRQLVRLWFDRDQAAYLKLMRVAVMSTQQAPSARVWDELEQQIERAVASNNVLIDGTIWKMMFPKVGEAGRAILGLQVRVQLVRAALMARQQGAQAALAWLASTRDPFNDEALHTQLDADGILALWSVGFDGEADPLGAQDGDDIRVEVRAR
jgi:hypothetical protein